MFIFQKYRFKFNLKSKYTTHTIHITLTHAHTSDTHTPTTQTNDTHERHTHTPKTNTKNKVFCCCGVYGLCVCGMFTVRLSILQNSNCDAVYSRNAMGYMRLTNSENSSPL